MPFLGLAMSLSSRVTIVGGLPSQVMLGGGHINADMQQFLENDKKAQRPGALVPSRTRVDERAHASPQG